jgi:hypothetical protein
LSAALRKSALVASSSEQMPSSIECEFILQQPPIFFRGIRTDVRRAKSLHHADSAQKICPGKPLLRARTIANDWTRAHQSMSIPEPHTGRELAGKLPNIRAVLLRPN